MSTSIKEFLIERCIQDAEYIADEMQVQKINIDVLKTMTTEDRVLKMYIPSYGDRLALLNFSKQSSSSKRKSALFDKLISKVKKKDDDINESEINTTNKGLALRNASLQRYIEIGWLHFQQSAYKQVRTISGGGTRKVRVQKSLCKSSIIDLAKGLFFPDGKSSKGMIDQFSINLFDFQKNDLPDDLSVGELYAKTGLNSIRFYLATKQSSVLLSSLTNSESHLSQTSFTPSPPPVKNVDQNEQPVDELSTYNMWSITPSPPPVKNDDHNEQPVDELSTYNMWSITPSPPPVKNDDQNEQPVDGSSIYNMWSITPSPPPVKNDDQNEQPVDRSSENLFTSFTLSPPLVNNLEQNEQSIQFYSTLNEHNYFNMPEPCVETLKLILHRGRIFVELMEAFKNIKNCPSKIEFELILPNGSSENAVDFGGVYKDVMSEFWSSFYEMATTGCHWKIPTIRHDFQLEEWQAIAKIIYVGWRDVNYLPISLALPFMESVLCENKANTQDLVEGFLNTLPLKSKDLLKSAIKDFSKIDHEELLDVLQEFDCRLLVHEHNINAVISEIAHKELIQRPKYIIDIWSEELKGKMIISKNSLEEEYKNKIPTSTNIIQNLYCPEKDINEVKRKIFGFLKKFIREADQMLCTKLLRFITGADIITSSINVNFNSMKDGFSRSPVAHTCTNTLDLPLTYDSFIDLRCELTSLLSSNVWVMDVA